MTQGAPRGLFAGGGGVVEFFYVKDFRMDLNLIIPLLQLIYVNIIFIYSWEIKIVAFNLI